MEPWVLIVVVALVLLWRLPPLWRGIRGRSVDESAMRENPAQAKDSNTNSRKL